MCLWHERPTWILRLYANIFTSQFSRWHVESKRCSIKSKGESFHYHQPLEGSAPGFGSITKLAQIYSYRFCTTLKRSFLPRGNPRALYPTHMSLAVDLLEDLDIDELRGVQKQLADFTSAEQRWTIYKNK